MATQALTSLLSEEESLQIEEEIESGALGTNSPDKNEESAEQQAEESLSETENNEQSDKEAEPESDAKPEEGSEKQSDPSTDEGSESETQGEVELETRIKQYAEKNDVSIDEAKQDIETIDSVKEYFGNDTEKIAKAYRHMEQRLSRSQNEIQELKGKGTKVQYVDPEQHVVIDGNIYQRDDVIKMYRQKNPEFCKDHEDDTDAIVDRAKEVIGEELKVHKEKHEIENKKLYDEMKEKSQSKVQDIIHTLPERDRKFISGVKELIKNTKPEIIMHDNFDMEYFLRQVRGERYHEDISKAEERGFKRAMDNKRIVNDNKTPSGGGKPAIDKKGGGSGLSVKEEKEAMSMFANIPEEERFEAYKEFNEIKKQKKKT